jgi:hypothetical protein
MPFDLVLTFVLNVVIGSFVFGGFMFVPPVLFWVATVSDTTAKRSLYEIYLAAVTVAPLIAPTVLFAFELILRPYVSALFPQGGVERFHSPFALTPRKKLLFVNLERIIERADEALYAAKTSGRNRVRTSEAVSVS